VSAEDLSGEWRGIFNYPASAGPPTEFTAVLHDAAGALSGTTAEPSLSGGTIEARIDGRRQGSGVTFTKLYDPDAAGLYDTVAYTGEVDADGLEITGRWDIPGYGGGTFIMVRDTGVAIGAEEEEEARLDR
jgi:hypothetical protein